MTDILYKDWKKEFKKDIKSKLDFGEQEFSLYKKTGYIIYLQQSGNKLFSAVENYLMLKYDKRVSNYKDLRKMVENNKSDKELLLMASQLHYFFHNGELQISRDEAKDFYINVRDRLKNRLK